MNKILVSLLSIPMIDSFELSVVVLLFLFSTSILCTLHFILYVPVPVLIALTSSGAFYFLCARLRCALCKEE